MCREGQTTCAAAAAAAATTATTAAASAAAATAAAAIPALLPYRTRGALLLEEGGEEFRHAQLGVPLEGARKGRRVVDVCRQQMGSAAMVAAPHLHKLQHQAQFQALPLCAGASTPSASTPTGRSARHIRWCTAGSCSLHTGDENVHEILKERGLRWMVRKRCSTMRCLAGLGSHCTSPMLAPPQPASQPARLPASQPRTSK